MKSFIILFLFFLNLNAFVIKNVTSKNVLSSFDRIKQSLDSVVSINLFNQTDTRMQGVGSGVLVSSSGYIITNYHVIKNSANIKISFSESKQKYNAKIIGFDKASDIAVLKIQKTKHNAIYFANSNKLRLSDEVFAIGNGFGLGTTVSKGIVSALNKRSIGIYEYENLIQTDATINPGNSGGALVNSNGNLIGINSVIYTRSGGSEGVGFAIPSNTVKIISTAIINKGSYNRGYLGVSFEEKKNKVIIESIDAKSQAFKNGLVIGDVILSINSEPIDEIGDVLYILGLTQVGETISIKYLHKNRKYIKNITLLKRP